MEVVKRKATGVLGEMIKNMDPESLANTRKEMIKEVENQELLFTDLCGRLPHGVKAQVCGWDEEKGEVEVPLKIYSINTDGYVYFETNDYDVNYLPVEDVRPYLRPLSSMTEEEKEQMRDLWIDADTNTHAIRLIDFYNKYHFDYRGLIPAGLALSTEKFNPYKD